MLPLVQETPATVALTVVVPTPTPLIKPLLFTKRTFVLPLVQLVASPVASILAVPVAASCTVSAGSWVPVMTMLLTADRLAEVGVRFVSRTLELSRALAPIYLSGTTPFHIRSS